MKKANFILLFALATFTSFGQKIRFTDSTNVWEWYDHAEYMSSPIIAYCTDSFIGDTTIHAIQYKTLHHIFSNPSDKVYIREDTIAKKIFAIAEIHPDYDTSEQLLYDYTLNIGDTFRSKHSVHTVATIDSVMINSTWHRVWYFLPLSTDSPIFSLRDYYVIEGIGCINEPCFPHSPYRFETRADVTCFTTNGITPPLSHQIGYCFNNSTSCDLTFGLNVNDVAKAKATSVIPNPIDKTAKIVFPNNVSGSLTVLNSIGQAVVNMPFTNKDEIVIGDKITAPGLYYYRVTDEQGGKVFSGKFVY